MRECHPAYARRPENMRITIATPSPSNAGTISALKIPAIMGSPPEDQTRLVFARFRGEASAPPSRPPSQKLKSPAAPSAIAIWHRHLGEKFMALSMYSGFVPVCLQLLGGLKNVLQKAEAHATEQKWDPNVVLNLRLYPDMFTLERQVRQVCNHALGALRVAGTDLPSLPDQDNSFAEVQSRIDKTVDFLKGLSAGQIDGKDGSDITVTIGGQP